MILYTFKEVQRLPVSIEVAWDFFSSPLNLKELTPPEMNFQVLSEVEGTAIYPGMIIQYNVTPLLGIQMGWVTEITQVKQGVMFIDEQRFGPYAFWHHQHHFIPLEKGIEMIDLVHYKLPFGALGRIASPFVASKLNNIFAFRRKVLISKFGT